MKRIFFTIKLIYIFFAIFTYTFSANAFLSSKIYWKNDSSNISRTWDIGSNIEEMIQELPEMRPDIKEQFNYVSFLRAVMPVKESIDLPEMLMAVVMVSTTVNVSLEKTITKIPIDEWADHLSFLTYYSREVVDTREDGVTKQIIRTVVEMGRGQKYDTTTAQVITYKEDVKSVYWRVRYAGNMPINNRERAGIGKLEFRKIGKDKTRITFFSSHKSSLMGFGISNYWASKYFMSMFYNHLLNFKKIIEN